jgi:hypothetical protein
MNPVLGKVPFDNRPHVANALGAFAIGAEAGSTQGVARFRQIALIGAARCFTRAMAE